MSGRQKFVLEDDEPVDSGRSVGQIATFQVEQPRSGSVKAIKEEKEKKRTIDVFVGQDKVQGATGSFSPPASSIQPCSLAMALRKVVLAKTLAAWKHSWHTGGPCGNQQLRFWQQGRSQQGLSILACMPAGDSLF
jgi:hypothetical protein